MKDGFIKVGAATPEIKPADCVFNAESIISSVADAYMRGVRVLVLPELCVSGSTCGDLFLQSTLLDGVQSALGKIVDASAGFDMICAVGAPLRTEHGVCSCSVVFSRGKIISIIPKTVLPEGQRSCFAAASEPALLVCGDIPDLRIGVEFGDELGSPFPPSEMLSAAGADVILCLCSSPELAGKAEYRRTLVSAQSARLGCAYILAESGDGESTTDAVYGGHCIIAENGHILAESEIFENGLVTADIDLGRIMFGRRKRSLHSAAGTVPMHEFRLAPHDTELTRVFPRLPFVPEGEDELAERCRLMLHIQTAALAKRMTHVNASKVVVGISGGLDSALALIVCSETMLKLRLPRAGIIAVTMPCFGTSGRTRKNARRLCGLLGATLREIDIAGSVSLHFSDIGHDPEVHNTAFENAQARERTQILMDIANDENGLVVGTGDLSELALGWATFAGDHISMYGVNASLPKTLIRRIASYYADNCGSEELCAVIHDIIDTPVSPELLPSVNGEISQKTEDNVGPYELHDFFIYHTLRCGYSPKKLYRTACAAFDGEYEPEVILKWLKVFCCRFFSQQFKRSCLPDGPAAGPVSLSPRGGFAMPSDVSASLWLSEAESIVTDSEADE